MNWLEIAGGLAAVATAVGVVIAAVEHSKKRRLDFWDELKRWFHGEMQNVIATHNDNEDAHPRAISKHNRDEDCHEAAGIKVRKERQAMIDDLRDRMYEHHDVVLKQLATLEANQGHMSKTLDLVALDLREIRKRARPPHLDLSAEAPE